MADARMAKNLRRWAIAIATHNVENPEHDPAFGIGLSFHDIGRLGLIPGEELWDGINVCEISIGAGQFRVMCNGEHDECDLRVKEAREAEKPVDAVAKEPVHA